MAELNASNNPLTANGTFTFKITPGVPYILSAAGTWGGGSLAVNYVDEDGNVVPFEDSPLTGDGDITISAAAGIVSLTLSGATSPSIRIQSTNYQEVIVQTGSGNQVAPVAVADAAARKLASTYATADVTPTNGMKVIQADVPDVVWELLNVSDITDDANWHGQPRTNASGQLPLSGVKLIDGNVPFSFARYIPANSADWFPSSTAKYIRLFEGITIPASLVVAGNKIAFSGTVRGRKDSSGISTQLALTFQQATMFDFIEANPTTTTDSYIPVVSITDSAATLEFEGVFQALFTLTAVTGTPSKLRLVANSDFTDGGKIYSFTSTAYAALANPTADDADSAGLPTNITAGEDLDLVIAVQGGANSQNKIHQITVIGGVYIYVP